MSSVPAKVGVIGCGNISTAYFSASQRLHAFDIVACADLDMERARARADEYQIRALTVDQLLAEPEVDLIINLTIPQAHADVALQVLAAGKSVYGEKPLALDRAAAQAMLQAAATRNMRVGSAPDTFLGGGIQTCIQLLDANAIGQPVAATAFMLGHGHESWHPDPAFYYQRGGGPMFDMGPYYLTALVALLGPIRRVTGSTRITFPERIITSQPKAGTTIVVETPTHLAAVLDFASGAIATLVTSFDVWAAEVPHIEIYGTQGTLSVPDPNTFGGPVRLRRAGESEWKTMSLTRGFATNSRGIGVAELIYARQAGRPHRASGDLAAHVLDAMLAVEEASVRGEHIALASTVARPAPLPPGSDEAILGQP
jgi:predicted dehydrogenase